LTGAEAGEARERIFAWGTEIGVSALGVAPATRPPRAGFLLEWLLRGYQASMNYLSRDAEARSDPARILEGCASVLCLALDYGGVEDPAANDPTLGRISRYAWGDDYHVIMKEKCEALATRICGEWPEARTRVAVDTSPVLEKAFAARAGLGWIGKHTNLIDEKRGSWFFLGEIFTTLPLPPSETAADRCGSCSRCIEICPTEAIVEPYVLDARRCLSYWNIEHRGEIERSIAGRMGNWIFGCDLCQEVCPWNRESSPGLESPAVSRLDARFAPRGENVGRPLDEWSGLTQEEFSRRFRDSAVKRARYDGFSRNVEIARRNAGEVR
jgi:epoxyqueuosine reductase